MGKLTEWWQQRDKPLSGRASDSAPQSAHLQVCRYCGSRDHDTTRHVGEVCRYCGSRDHNSTGHDAVAAARRQTCGKQLLDKHKDLIQKFLAIAERKCSILDEYGDESLHLLPSEVDLCISKIAGREGLNEVDFRRELKSHSEGNTNFALLNLLAKVPLGFGVLWLRENLPQVFADYHKEFRERSARRNEIASLSGMEFETYVARKVRACGFDVVATPATGDQGADLIAKKGNRTIVIQAKRYSGSVGNSAVQEVVGALAFYAGDEGAVITSSTFTPSARALAQKNNVRLIDGAQLERIGELLGSKADDSR